MKPRRPRPRHSTVPKTRPPRVTLPAVPRRAPLPPAPPRRELAHILEPDASLLDVIDSLLNKGVVLNADIILALANVDLVYLRLSALLCAADRVFERGEVDSMQSSVGNHERTRPSIEDGD
jgi:gas vesicle structural protein